MSRDRGCADAKACAVAKRAHVLHGYDSADSSRLGIVARYAAFFEHLGAPWAGDNPRPASALQFCDSASMVEVDVRVHDQLHVFEAEAEGFYVGRDLSCRLRQVAIDENMSGWRCD